MHIGIPYILFSGYHRVATNVEEMVGYKPNILFRACWQFLIPLAFVVSAMFTFYALVKSYSLTRFHFMTVTFDKSCKMELLLK